MIIFERYSLDIAGIFLGQSRTRLVSSMKSKWPIDAGLSLGQQDSSYVGVVSADDVVRSRSPLAKMLRFASLRFSIAVPLALHDERGPAPALHDNRAGGASHPSTGTRQSNCHDTQQNQGHGEGGGGIGGKRGSPIHHMIGSLSLLIGERSKPINTRLHSQKRISSKRGSKLRSICWDVPSPFARIKTKNVLRSKQTHTLSVFDWFHLNPGCHQVSSPQAAPMSLTLFNGTTRIIFYPSLIGRSVIGSENYAYRSSSTQSQIAFITDRVGQVGRVESASLRLVHAKP